MVFSFYGAAIRHLLLRRLSPRGWPSQKKIRAVLVPLAAVLVAISARAQDWSQLLSPLPRSAVADPPTNTRSPQVDKTVLNGPVVLRWEEEGGVQRVVVKHGTRFIAEQREAALRAARAAQKDVAKSCARQCKPGPMSPPKIDSSGHLAFDLAVQGLPRRLTEKDLPNLINGTPLTRHPS